ncbi:uncharacterized protein LOC127882276 isoform X1 [Dreissena polymorpha]|uniref:uncharacterized protein LOC127882276 isoform X1 n=1 Tax=Dreissena polymorpha TaxID=45954 RepID=UPI0022648C74|nr:uncharacterized protein LOC127882276 isoform X1 [Dreissena polymorpha]
MSSSFVEPRGIPTIFGEVVERNVAFCIDTSGSMYKGIEMVKEHLIETLKKMASTGKPYSFNLIEFNSEVNQWTDKLVTCTPQTVAVAEEWIKKMAAKTGTNTRDALLTALQDPLCDAVYLVTDGLPDQYPAEILEHVASVGGMRPIHCIYLSTEETTETAAIEFLEDLSIESYGSFHIVSLTTHGCVERITPIYRAEHAQERIIRTINGTIRPNIQRCSVATTLQVDPDDSISLAPRVFGSTVPPTWYPPWGPYWYDWLGMPFRYYYPYAWSRYRPAKGWIKAQEAMTESIETSGLSPAAGSLLINKQVLARRIDDGYFYQATVKSQILSDKFLVGFGPCKHGKYTDTIYQDTHVFDIIDYEDARRHTILTGDKVLAPWEPEGERYGPGTVIEGHEKRNAEGAYEVAITCGPSDKEIAVSFTNGKVSNVPLNTAIWVPREVYERITLELKMPRDARQELMTEERYPMESKQGYPTSGPSATPPDYELADPLLFDYDPMVVERRGPWRYPFHPPYPLIMKKGLDTTRRHQLEREERDTDKVVPGTSLSEQELNDRIASQLMEHKLLLDERETEKGTRKEKREPAVRKGTVTSDSAPRPGSSIPEELQKRLDETHRLWCEEMEKKQLEQASTERSLGAEDPIDVEAQLQRKLEERRQELDRQWEAEQALIQSQIERERLLKRREKQEENHLRSKSVSFSDAALNKDDEESGYQSHLSQGTSSGNHYDGYYSDPEDMTSQSLREQGVNTEASLLQRPRSSRSGRRPPWKNYWRADPSMPIVNAHQGPFRETALAAPLEARDMSRTPYIAEWTSPVYRYVDPFAKHNYTDSVEKCLKPPTAPPPRQVGVATRPTHTRPMSADTKAALRQDFKRRREEQRSRAWDMRMKNWDNMQGLMEDQHKERVQAQISREKDRQVKEQRQIEQSREQKKFVSKEIREKKEDGQRKEVHKEEMRIRAMQQRREHREEAQRQRERQTEELQQRRAELKAAKSQERWNSVHRRLDQEEAENSVRAQQHQHAKVQRIQHFQNLEEKGQRRKDVRIGVTDRHLSMFESVPLF